jgi:hypothetical protein
VELSLEICLPSVFLEYLSLLHQVTKMVIIQDPKGKFLRLLRFHVEEIPVLLKTRCDFIEHAFFKQLLGPQRKG